MADLVRQRREFLGGLHPGKQRDPPAIRQALRGSDLVGVIQRDAMGFDELDQSFTVAADITLHFGETRKVFPVRLADIEDIHSPESVQRGLILLGILVRFRILTFPALVTDHRSENENALFATPN